MDVRVGAEDRLRVFGKRMKAELKQRGITQAELAEVCQTEERTVRRWLAGEQSPRGDKLALMVAALALPADRVLAVLVPEGFEPIVKEEMEGFGTAKGEAS